jgi:hypothetical protein
MLECEWTIYQYQKINAVYVRLRTHERISGSRYNNERLGVIAAAQGRFADAIRHQNAALEYADMWQQKTKRHVNG